MQNKFHVFFTVILYGIIYSESQAEMCAFTASVYLRHYRIFLDSDRFIRGG